MRLDKISGVEQSMNEPPAAEINFLKNPSLIFDLLSELQKVVVGEQKNCLTLFVIAQGGRLVENAQAESSNIMVNDESGAGKDFIVNAVLDLLPIDVVVRRKRITPTVLTYWHNASKEPNWTWDGKVFYCEDINNSVLNCDVFKVMSSSKGDNWSTITIKQTAVDVLVRGKPVMIVTIYSANPSKETLRRYPIINLDVSESQTKRIVSQQAKLAVKGVCTDKNQLIPKALSHLHTCKVRVPWALLLEDLLNTKFVIIRTHFNRMLDYVKFSAAIHQFQREVDEEGYILANSADYGYARIMMMQTTSNVFSIPLSKKKRRVLEIFNAMPNLDKSYSVTELMAKVAFCTDRTLYRLLDQLVEDGFLQKSAEYREHSRKDVMVYNFVKGGLQFDIPSWNDLQKVSSKS